jgi:two-component system, LytTR family, sensor histidine kinase AgrC
MRWIGEKLIGDPLTFSFEQRILHLVVMLGIFMTAFGTVMDILYYQVEILADLIFFGVWILMYYFARFHDYFQYVSVISIGILIFAFIPYMWIFNGGSNSIIPYYTILFAAVIGIILTGRFRLLMFFSLLIVELLLILRDVFHAGTFFAIIPGKQDLFDFSIHIFVIMVTMGILITVYSNTYMKEKKRSEDYFKAIEEQYRQQIYYMKNLEQAIFKLKSERHDFNHHIGVIYGLLEGRESGEALEYVARLVKDAEEYRNIVNLPYAATRSMLNYKLSSVRDHGIKLCVSADVPEGLSITEVDLTVILGNLLDNAIEACLKLKENERFLNFSLYYKPDYLILKMENPMGDNTGFQKSGHEGERKTSKQDEQNHGFGLKNIEYLVSKHNGFLNITSDNGIFRVDLAMLISEQ